METPKFYGSTGSIKLNKPIVGIVGTNTGKGYWFVASDGGIFSYGDAVFFGSAAATPNGRLTVGMSAMNNGARAIGLCKDRGKDPLVGVVRGFSSR